MARLTRTQRRKLEAVYHWYHLVYLPWWQRYGADIGDALAAKYQGHHHAPQHRTTALWPPRSIP